MERVSTIAGAFTNRLSCFASELVEERVLAVVRGPDGQVVAPGDAALRRFPEQPGVGMLGEFVQADVSAIDSHGLRTCGKGDDARAVIKLDDPDFDILGESRGPASFIHRLHLE